MPASVLRPGQRLANGAGEPDRYIVQRIVGRGGVCEVYLIDTPGVAGGPFCAKIALRGSSVPRLYREAMWMGRRIPGVVPCQWVDHVISNDRIYPMLVMPFFREGTLKSRIAAGTYSAADAIGWIWSISSALEQCQCVHRDIKPENILFAGGQPLVADFGLAIEADPDIRPVWGDAEDARRFVGTVAYVSPEIHLLMDGVRSICPASDIYALGLMLYELIVGHLPLTEVDDVNASFQMKVSASWFDRDKVSPAALAPVIERATAHKRMDRYPSHAALRHDLEAVAATLRTRKR